ncbi:MAG: sortase [bacterium]
MFSGVVKYPSTPEPGTKGNALIFGHTSYYRWKKNPYGEIFAKIYSLHTGDEIKVARKGQLYTYEIVDSQVVTPNKVDSTYMQYTNGEYITLMGCYPIGTDSRR